MPSAERPFLGLLAELQRNRFPIGVDHHVRIARVLEQMGGSCDFASLKTLLCPLIATSRDEQRRFYDIFDRYYALRSAAPPPPPPPPSPGPQPQPKSATGGPKRNAHRGNLAAAMALLALSAAPLGYYIGKTWPPPDRAPAATTSSNTTVPPDTTPIAEPADVPELTLEGSTAPPTWFHRHHRRVAAGAAGAPLVVLGLTEWLRRRRRRRGGAATDAVPPFHWTIRAPPAPPWYRGEQFAHAVRLLRMREEAEHLRPDVERSIKATIEEGGYPTWRFRSDTRPPEYVFLVDRAGPRDHQAKHYASLVKGLDDEDLFVELWFFDRDPLICTTDSTKPSTSLADLARRRSGSRLVVFADGESLVDPISGQPADWMRELAAWSKRAILTPRPPAGWGEVEIGFERERLAVRPGTLEGLKAVGYNFAAETGPNRRHWLARAKDVEAFPDVSPSDLDEIRATLRADLYQWVCACAVYPELHWELTVELGRRLGGTRLLTEANLLALARLPWFRAGAIPDRIRERLIADLDPDVRQRIHDALAELLARDPPDEQSFAAQRYAENLAVQRLGAAKSEDERQGLRSQLKALAPERLFREAEIAGLESRLPLSPVARLVPRRWWDQVFEDGHPLYDVKRGIPWFLVTCLALGAWRVVPTPEPPLRSFRFVPDSVTLTRTGPGLRLSITADSVDSNTISVEDTMIGSLDRLGYLRPRAVGSTRLRAVRMGDTASARITVVDVERLAVVPPSITLVIGDSLQLDISNPPTRAIPSWRSDAPRIASVSSSGMARGISRGETRMVVQRGNQSGSAAVTVVPRLPVGVAPSAARLQVGDTVRLRVFTYEKGDTNYLPRAAWSSSDPKVASVASSGVVRGEAPGQTAITAATQGGRVVVRVTVTPPDTAPTAAQQTPQQADTSQKAPELEDADTSPQQYPVQQSPEEPDITQQAPAQNAAPDVPDESPLAEWERQARQSLRQRDSVSPLSIPSGETVELQKVARGGRFYAFTSSARLPRQSLDGPLFVRSGRTPEFDLEVHTRTPSDRRLVGFVTAEQARLLANGESPERLELAAGPSMNRRCLVSVGLDDYGSPGLLAPEDGLRVLRLTRSGKATGERGTRTSCYQPAAAY